MTRIVHLTDLHFGSHRAELVDPLRRALGAARPDLVVVTGDLSHRAHGAQLAQAVAFLDGLGLRYVAMPGNHDMSLFNLPRRFLMPFRGWRRHVSPDPAPAADVGDLRIRSANTADPFSWRRGVLRDADLRRIVAGVGPGPGSGPGTGSGLGVMACHHPLVEPPGFKRGETRGAAQALPALVQAGVRVVLSGHLHHWEIGLGITPDRPGPILHVQTGTALCQREDERDHGFSVLDHADPLMTVTPWIVDETTAEYRPRPARRFRLDTAGWCPAD